MENFKLNKSDYSLIGGYLFIVSFWLIFRFRVENYQLCEYLIDIPVSIIQILLLLAAAKWLIEFYFIKKGSLVVFIILSFTTLWIASFLTMVSGDFTRFGRIPWENYMPFTETIIFNVHNSVYNIAIPLMLISGKKYYEHQLVVTQLINSKKEIELKLLQSQFDPHFLYNSLNTIDALVDYASKDNIKEYVANLAELYRHRIMVKDEDVISLDQEIALGKNYLFFNTN